MVRYEIHNYLAAYRAGVVPLYPALLALAYTLHVYLTDWGLAEAFELYLPLIWIGIGAIIISPSQKLGLVAGLFVVANIIAGSLGFLNTLAYVTVAALWLAILAVFYGRRITLSRASPWLNLITTALILIILLGEVPGVIAGRTQAVEAQGPLVDWSTVEDRPDIYYLIPDGYTNREGMFTAYNAVNNRIYRELAAQGFDVYPNSRSNYPLTMLTLGAALNMEYPLLPGEKKRLRALKHPINEALVFRELQAGGYQYIHAGGNWFLDGNQADIHLMGRVGFGTSFHHKLISETWIPFIWGLLGGQFAYYHTLDGLNQDITRNIKRAIDLETDGPKLVIGHWLLPHDPFYLDENCTFAPTASSYATQVLCMNQILKEVVALIPTDAVVIIQADHGAWAAPLVREMPTPRGATSPHDLTDQQIIDTRLGNFAAYRNLATYPNITPVNTWRVLFNQYFGTELEMLPDQFYLSYGYNDPMEVYSVKQ